VTFLLAALCFLLGWWRVHREPRLWTLLCATIYTSFGAVSVIRYFLGDETIRSAGVRYHYVIGVRAGRCSRSTTPAFSWSRLRFCRLRDTCRIKLGAP
jgi:hypothetical protein